LETIAIQGRAREYLAQTGLIRAPNATAAGSLTITTIEPFEKPLPTWLETLSALDRHTVTNAFISWLYAVTGPLAILLAVASKVGFGQDQLATWLFGAYAIGGLISILTSYLYRQPSGIAFSIPGAILIGPALDHLSFGEVVGANLAAGILIVVLGLTGWVRKVMIFCPMPVVMGMVCGVFLPFGLKIVTGFQDNFWIAFAIVAAFLVASAMPAIGRVVPPIIAALIAGAGTVFVIGGGTPTSSLHFAIVEPIFFAPEFSYRALFELVLPLAITVVGIHNPQGFAALEAANYKPPINALTFACGIGTIMAALVGSVPTCVAGPSNAIMCSSGTPRRRFVAGIVYGLLFIIFGVLAPVAAGFSAAIPAALIGVLGGLALIRALQGWMATAFGGELSLGALAAFLLTLSGISILHIGAAFWGLVFGIMVSWLMERTALRKAWAPTN
jgi:benzoate membrane transport protein